MARATSASNPFVQVETVHQAEISWWWKDGSLHDNAYHVRVNDSVDKKVKEIVSKYEVEDDIQYATQWEGRLFVGADLRQVTDAANELARHMAKFKGLAPLREFSGD